MKKSLLIPITETAILIALAFVLELTSKMFPLFNKPQGGHITLSFLPLMVIGYRHGLKYGLLGGLCYACIELIFAPQIYHYGSIFFDYLFAYAVFGLTGLAVKKAKNIYIYVGGIIVCGFLKFFCHFLSGIILFREYAINAGYENELAIWTYSFVYNIDYVAFSTIIACILGVCTHRIIVPKNHRKDYI